MTIILSETWRVMPLVLFAIVLFFPCYFLYNIFLHPLRSYPGPWYTKSSIAWFMYHTYIGDYHMATHRLHLKYGPVVRVAPNELAYTDPQAWKDIYGHRSGAPENIKDPSQIVGDDPGHPSIIFAPREEHSKVRRLLSNAFSDKAIREQEPIITSYVKLMIRGLREACDEPVDLVKWYNFTTFDIIGHLAFAESFDCLTNSAYHPWVELIFSTFKFVTWLRALNRLVPNASSFMIRLIPKRVLREHNANFALSKEKLLRRKDKRPEYTDFMTHLLVAEEKGQLTIRDILSNAPVFVVAGSETTATLLSGATFYLLQNPRVYKLLVDEVRSAFEDPSEITVARTNGLKYLLAVLDEALRLYPPGTNNHPRLTPAGGATIAGRYVPPNTMVGINQYAMFRSPLNFHDPEAFVPERSLRTDDTQWSGDKRHAIQPFSFGTRNCIGRNLAYVEMRLIMAHLLFEFDLELQQGSGAWLDQKVYTSWEKKPLMVKLHSVREK